MGKSFILVGGFPKPIGGVTTFVRRLAASDKRIDEVVDIYFDKDKEIPLNYLGRYKRLNNKLFGFLYLFFRMVVWRNKYIHFNFSNMNSLVFFLFLPKLSTKWILMLHHGVLESCIPAYIVRYLLRRFDYIYCMNNQQFNAYRMHGIVTSKLVKASSYIKPTICSPDIKFQQEIDSYFSSKPTFIASGYPTLIYNFDWCVRFIKDRKEYQLALFIYGEGSEKIRFEEQLKQYENIRVYWDQREDNFNYALMNSFYYIRPNARDSFGIAVADAVNFNVKVLASDVCPRFQGAGTFKITTYDSFESDLVASLNKVSTSINTEKTPFVPFSYDLIN